jgi:hypothetical protein
VGRRKETQEIGGFDTNLLIAGEGIGRIRVRRGRSRTRRGTKDEFLVHRRVCYINVHDPFIKKLLDTYRQLTHATTLCDPLHLFCHARP